MPACLKISLALVTLDPSNILATLFGQVAPIPADDVQTFELLLHTVSPITMLLHHQGCVFLLLQQ